MQTLPEANPAAFEITYWDTIKDSTDPEDFKSYLAKYPNSQFADLARRRSQARSTTARAMDSRSASTTTTTSPVPTPAVPTPAVPNTQQRPLMLPSVFMLGLNLGVAQIGAYQNSSNDQLLQYLGTAHDSAVSTGVATDQVDYLLNQLRAGASSQSQYQGMLSARQSSGLSTYELQAILRQVNSGRTTRDQYQPLLNLRGQADSVDQRDLCLVRTARARTNYNGSGYSLTAVGACGRSSVCSRRPTVRYRSDSGRRVLYAPRPRELAG